MFRKTIQFVHDVMHLWRQELRKQTYKILNRINHLSHGVASVFKYHTRLFSFTSSSYDRRKIQGIVLQDTGLAGLVLMPHCYSTSNPSSNIWYCEFPSLSTNMTKVLKNLSKRELEWLKHVAKETRERGNKKMDIGEKKFQTQVSNMKM